VRVAGYEQCVEMARSRRCVRMASTKSVSKGVVIVAGCGQCCDSGRVWTVS
jgi:hypothetical protein